MGFVVGLYAYVAGYAPTTNSIEQAVGEIGTSLTVTSEVYGGCDRTGSCPSYNIDAAGQYRYSYASIDSGELLLLEGSLPLRFQQDLSRYATPEALTEMSRPVQQETCNSFVDGVDVRYTIVLDSERFVLDSCRTSVMVDGELWVTLRSIWEYLQKQ